MEAGCFQTHLFLIIGSANKCSVEQACVTLFQPHKYARTIFHIHVMLWSIISSLINNDTGRLVNRAGGPIRQTRRLPRAPGKGGAEKYQKPSEI